jgi:uncharacterized Zn finger protein
LLGHACQSCGSESVIVGGAQWTTPGASALGVALRCANCGAADTISLSLQEARRYGFDDPA